MRDFSALGRWVSALCAAFAILGNASAASLVQVQIGPQDGYHVPGTLTDPSCCTYPDFALHDHGYVAAHLPDPNRAWVAMTFDAPVVLSGLDVVQHANGITRIEHFVGADMSTLVSVGNAFGLRGDVTGDVVFAEYERDRFDWTSQSAGTMHYFVVTKTSNPAGWATYRWYPDFATPVPEPQTYALMVLGLALLGARASRARRG